MIDVMRLLILVIKITESIQSNRFTGLMKSSNKGQKIGYNNELQAAAFIFEFRIGPLLGSETRGNIG